MNLNQLQGDLFFNFVSQIQVRPAGFGACLDNDVAHRLEVVSSSSTRTQTEVWLTLASREWLRVFSAVKVPLNASTFLAASKTWGTGRS